MAKGRLIPGWRPEPPPRFALCNALLLNSNLSASEKRFHARNLSPKQSRYLQIIIDHSMRDKPQHRHRRRGHAGDLDDEILFF
jgi:hypothetical protein